MSDARQRRTPSQTDCTYAIQTAKGWYLGMKGPWVYRWFTARISDPNAAPSIGFTAYWQLVARDL